jgi:hypothetical protein
MTSAPGAACRPLTNTPSTTENPLFLHIGHKRLTCAFESASAIRRLNSIPAVTGGIGVCRVSLMTAHAEVSGVGVIARRGRGGPPNL